MGFNHTPVLLKEAIKALNLGAGKTIVDATLGLGGHTKAILEKIPGGTLICIDKDIAAIEYTKTEIDVAKDDLQTVEYAQGDYADIAKILDEKGIGSVDGILADLGVSSYQIDTAERGFSYMHDALLDMRMDRNAARTAYHVVNFIKPEKLMQIIRDFGEEKYARQITEAIVAARPLDTTLELAEVIKKAVPSSYYKTGGHPAKRTFQAIRIEVNNELESLEKFITAGTAKLKKGGRIAIITFHSLEDRIVKQTFKTLATDCICPPRSPVCICRHKATLKILTKKPIEPGEEERENNPRSHSAKLRIAEKI